MSEELKYAAGLVMMGLTWVGRLIWVNHTDVQSIKANHPTWSDLKEEMQECSDDKDSSIGELKTDITVLNSKLDQKTTDLTKVFNDRHDQTQTILREMSEKIGAIK